MTVTFCGVLQLAVVKVNVALAALLAIPERHTSPSVESELARSIVTLALG